MISVENIGVMQSIDLVDLGTDSDDAAEILQQDRKRKLECSTWHIKDARLCHAPFVGGAPGIPKRSNLGFSGNVE